MVKFVLVAVAILEECCMASADMQWLFYSGGRIVARVCVCGRGGGGGRRLLLSY